MNKKLIIALRRCSSEQGFAIPIAVGLGFIMLLTAATMILRSQGDRTNASAQNATASALSAAETGITHFQDLINSNRTIATYPDCVGTRDSTTGACPDTSPTASWANASSIPGVSSCGSNSQAQLINNSSTTNWQYVDKNSPPDASKGQYKLVSYRYTPNTSIPANTAPGTGTLTVQGRINQVSTGNSATATVGTATTQMQVTIPITTSPGTLPINTGLWATSFSFNGNGIANANVLDSSSCPSGTSSPPSWIGNLPSPPYLPNTKGTYKKDIVPFPLLPNNNTYTVPTGTNVNTLSCSNNPLDKPKSTVILPQTNDIDSTGKAYGSASPPPLNATYTYVIPCSGNSIDLSGNSGITLGQSGQETIIIYVNGNISMAGNGDIAPYTNTTTTPNKTTKVIFYVQGDITIHGNGSAFDPSYFQFYKYGSGSITLTGNGSAYAFIYAPQADVTLTGNGDINGAIWTKSFTAKGNGSINQGMINTSSLQIPPPEGNNNPLSSISSWQRQQAN